MASIVCPFMGFWASGFKRAYHVKDFAKTLPGHGGFADRFDCMSNMCIFSYIMITQVIFREKHIMIDTLNVTKDLPADA